jgi:hypothetical protein
MDGLASAHEGARLGLRVHEHGLFPVTTRSTRARVRRCPSGEHATAMARPQKGRRGEVPTRRLEGRAHGDANAARGHVHKQVRLGLTTEMRGHGDALVHNGTKAHAHEKQ